MRITYASGVRNDLLQQVADQTIYPFGVTSLIPISFSFAGGLAPHTIVTKADYTVPANKKAIIGYGEIKLIRYLAPTAESVLTNTITITPNGGGAITILEQVLRLAAGGEKVSVSMNGGQLLTEGDNIKYQTVDTGTAGTIYYNMNVSIVEFDV